MNKKTENNLFLPRAVSNRATVSAVFFVETSYPVVRSCIFLQKWKYRIRKNILDELFSVIDVNQSEFPHWMQCVGARVTTFV